MTTIYFMLCLLSLAVSAPVNNKEVATILKYENTNDGLGSYSFEYETSDGSKRREEGVLTNPEDPEHSFVAVRGSYSYIGPDGVIYSVTYIADENGFQPIGSHIPGKKRVQKPAKIPLGPLVGIAPPVPAAFPPHIISILGGNIR